MTLVKHALLYIIGLTSCNLIAEKKVKQQLREQASYKQKHL